MDLRRLEAQDRVLCGGSEDRDWGAGQDCESRCPRLIFPEWGIFPTPVSAAASPSAGFNADGPAGHRVETSHRENVFGSVYTHTHSPVKGTALENPRSTPPLGSHHGNPGFGSGAGSHYSKVPKLQCPAFDGDNPKLWIRRVSDYFELAQVDPNIWIKLSAMYFSGSASRWLQSVEHKLDSCPWSTFCQMILDRFGKDHQKLLIRQLFHIKQLTTVAEYIECFSRLVDQLTAYETRSDQLYYTTRFMDGLKSQIRSAVVIQRPPDLDTACVLARRGVGSG